MKILVTGHKGFIGQNMVKALEKVHDVTGFEWGEHFPGYDYDLVIHLGAISSTTETDVDKIMRQNYDFSVWLLETCNRFGIDFQYASSASVYGFGTEFKEDSPVDPRTPYAWSKYMFERYALKRQAFGDHNYHRIQGFRYFNVYGSGEDHKGGQASPYHQFEKQARETGRIRVFEGSQDYRRDFVSVEQIIQTHLAFLNVKQSGVFNIGTGETKSFYEVAEQFGVPIEEIPMPEHLKSSYQTYTCADMTRTNRALAS
jgi:ADP-L-glycero-D-manno-heptose 6-epimerase